MDRVDYYNYYQANLELLNYEIDLVKKAAQTAIGKKSWQEKKGHNISQIAATDKEIQAGTRLYSFLICSWFEARLMKILYENSSAAFTDTEIASIRKLDSMDKKWKTCFSMAVCKGYGITYVGNIDYAAYFVAGSLPQKNYNNIRDLFDDIEDAITIRNRLAHGQWEFQFNSKNTAIANYTFFSMYDNIQKLDILKQCFDHIGDIISAYVTYKDKRNPRFDDNIRRKIELILEKKTRIKNSDYQKYTSQLGCRYESRRNRNIPANSD